MKVVQKGEFRSIRHFHFPSELQAVEIDSYIQVSLGPFPGRQKETLADTQKLQEKKIKNPSVIVIIKVIRNFPAL